MKYLTKIVVVLIFIIVLAYFKLYPSSDILGVFFTIHGIVYSIATSQIIGFNTSQVRNKNIRAEILSAIASTLKKLTILFIISAIFFLVPFAFKKPFVFFSLQFNFATIALPVILISLMVTIFSFISIRGLSLKVEETILKEQNAL